MEQMMGSMSSDEKEKMMENMMEKFFQSMTAEEKQKMMGNMMSKMMGGMNMSEMMPLMMSKMMGGMMSGEKEGGGSSKPGMESKENIKPWECCPCSNLCEKGFEMGSKKDEK